MTEREKLIRLAALIDAEGCIYVPKAPNRPSFTASVSIRICNTDPRMPLWCKQNFGGRFARCKSNKQNPKWRPAFEWSVAARETEEILRQCLPFFITKREQAEIALAYRETYKHNFGQQSRTTVAERKAQMPAIYAKRLGLRSNMDKEKKRNFDEFVIPIEEAV